MGEYTPEQATSPSGFENYATKASGNGLITTATSVTLNADRPFATNKIEYTAQSADEIKASYRLFTSSNNSLSHSMANCFKLFPLPIIE